MVDTPMPLTAHLAELRSRLIWCMVALAVGFSVCYGFSDKIVAALKFPRRWLGSRLKVPLQIIAPAEAFITYIISGSYCRAVSGPASSFASALEICRAWLVRTRKEVYCTVHGWLGSAVLQRRGHLLSRPPLYYHFLLSFAKGDIKAQLSVRYHVTFVSV